MIFEIGGPRPSVLSAKVTITSTYVAKNIK